VAPVVRTIGIGRLTFLFNTRVSGQHYGITAAFVRKYWQPLSNRSLVYLDGCTSQGFNATTPHPAQELRDAIFAKNADVIAGWTAEVHDSKMTEAALFFFDRLLGVNALTDTLDCTPSGADRPASCWHETKSPEEQVITGFKQRPFEVASVLQDMPQHDVGFDGATTFAVSGNNRILLAPSIRQIFIVEGNASIGLPGIAQLRGLFGVDPGEGRRAVSVGGNELSVMTWDTEVIAARLSDGGTLTEVGDAVVRVGDHVSNVARITAWRGTFTFTLTNGPFTETITFDVGLRADIRKARSRIHQRPEEPFASDAISMVPMFTTSRSAETHRCSGTRTFHEPDGTDVTVTWSGGDRRVGVVGDATLESSRSIPLRLDPNYSWPQLAECTQTTNGSPFTSDIDTPADAFADREPDRDTLRLVLDDSAQIAAGSIGPTSCPCDLPNLNNELGPPVAKFTWPAIAPLNDTAPDPDSAR